MDIPLPEQGQILTAIARAAIGGALGQPAPATEDAPWLQQAGASFVTLTQQGALRGCIGTLLAHRSVLEDVKANALSAALHDPRFAPLALEELVITRIEVSLLSPPQPLQFTSEADALTRLRPGVDGVVLEFEHHRSTFLPQVWEQLPQAQIFMAHLKRKAGLPDTFWHPGVRLQRYTVAHWAEAQTPP